MDLKVEKIALGERLSACYSGAVYDVLRAMGYPNQVLPSAIRPVNVQQQLAGVVFTVEGKRVKNASAEDTLLRWCEFLSMAPADAALICQPNDDELAHMGELSSETLKFKGVKGYIVDGGCRDSAFIEKIGFPVFCKYFTPVDVVGKWLPTAFGEPIIIGGVQVRTGDYVIADRDGIVVIPGDIAEETVSKTEEVLHTENLVRKAILQGTDPRDAYLKYGKF